MKLDVCAKYFEDIETCIEGVEKWTKPMIRGGLNSSDFGKTFCYHYGICRDQEVCTGPHWIVYLLKIKIHFFQDNLQYASRNLRISGL